VSTNRRTDKENMVYMHNGILFSLEKEIPTLYYNMDEPQKQYAKRKKPNTKGQILVDSTYLSFLG
jgi:hypothetical protein